MRDTYGNRMLADFTSQLRYHTASVLCNPRDMEDVRCTPVDEAPVEGVKLSDGSFGILWLLFLMATYHVQEPYFDSHWLEYV